MKIYINQIAKDKLDIYIRNVDAEVSGLGKVEIIDGDICVLDVALFHSENTPSETDICGESLSNFLVELIGKGEDIAKWRCWWHSHHKMGVFFSGTDTSTIEKLGVTFPWVVSIVGNQKREYDCRFDVFAPIHLHAKGELEVYHNYDYALEAELKAEIAEKVVIRKYVPLSNPRPYVASLREWDKVKKEWRDKSETGMDKDAQAALDTYVINLNPEIECSGHFMTCMCDECVTDRAFYQEGRLG
jgi:hypothetical protein